MKTRIILVVLLITFSLQCADKIGIALSGGGARGLAQIGVLKVIDSLGIKIDYISGTSTGAMIGALYALGYSGCEIEDIFKTIAWREILSDKIKRNNLYIGEKRWKPYANQFFALDDNFAPQLPQAFYSGHRLINKFFELTYPVAHVTEFDSLMIPFRCTATDVFTGRLKTFKNGSLPEAIRASMSLPSVFEPFYYQGNLYIDGGINANFPTEIVREMGADFVIGVKSNSGLKPLSELNSLIDILDQTVNFGINNNVENSIKSCDLLIEPRLDNITLLDFDRINEIVEIGEKAAIETFKNSEFTKSKATNTNRKNYNYLSDQIYIDRIRIRGNIYLSNSKVKQYLRLSSGREYSRNDIVEAIKMAYNSNLFSYIYPVLHPSEKGLDLYIYLREKNRKHLALSFSYNNENEFVAGCTFEFNNFIQKYSKLLLNFKLGNKTEANLDYVKNFGKHWGVYFRLFPYYKEFKLFIYNDDHEKMKSVKSRETGGTVGVGIYIQQALNAELFGYTFNTKTFRDIADFEDTYFRSSGIGVKLYHENLDNFNFPMRGSQIITKFTTARKEYYSDAGYKKYYARLQILLPFSTWFSVRYQFEYGSYFKKYDLDFDPFYIGGLDSFIGLYDRERSAPIYKINALALRFKIKEKFYTDLHYNFLSLGKSDVWLPDNNFDHALGIKLGYDSFLGPIRTAVAVNEEGKFYYYFSVGYEFDTFEFSRR